MTDSGVSTEQKTQGQINREQTYLIDKPYFETKHPNQRVQIGSFVSPNQQNKIFGVNSKTLKRIGLGIATVGAGALAYYLSKKHISNPHLRDNKKQYFSHGIKSFNLYDINDYEKARKASKSDQILFSTKVGSKAFQMKYNASKFLNSQAQKISKGINQPPATYIQSYLTSLQSDEMRLEPHLRGYRVNFKERVKEYHPIPRDDMERNTNFFKPYSERQR